MTQILQTYISNGQHYVTIQRKDDIIHLAITEQQYNAINNLIKKGG